VVLAFAPIAGHHIITWLIIGLIAGVLAAKVVDGGGRGIFRDTVIGLLGAILGGFLLHAAEGGPHATTSILVEILVAFAGAIILLAIERATRHRGRRRRRIRI
jgi:uncharacterized membrane protein YeaQ/YmgE (transglycosylase-associated protein family)